LVLFFQENPPIPQRLRHYVVEKTFDYTPATGFLQWQVAIFS